MPSRLLIRLVTRIVMLGTTSTSKGRTASVALGNSVSQVRSMQSLPITVTTPTVTARILVPTPYASMDGGLASADGSGLGFHLTLRCIVSKQVNIQRRPSPSSFPFNFSRLMYKPSEPAQLSRSQGSTMLWQDSRSDHHEASFHTLLSKRRERSHGWS